MPDRARCESENGCSVAKDSAGDCTSPALMTDITKSFSAGSSLRSASRTSDSSRRTCGYTVWPAVSPLVGARCLPLLIDV